MCNEGIRAISATTAADVVGRRALSLSSFLADNYYRVSRLQVRVSLQVRSRVCWIYSVGTTLVRCLSPASRYPDVYYDLYYTDDGDCLGLSDKNASRSAPSRSAKEPPPLAIHVYLIEVNQRRFDYIS